MKKTILLLVASTFIISSVLTSCSNPAEKLKDAQENANEANNDLNEANAEYIADVDAYRRDAAMKITANEQSIAEFKLRIENEKADAKADYQKKLYELEQRNSDMKKKMDDYKVEGKEKWEVFKADFSHSMDELGNAFKNLTTSKK